jgi:transcriptional regulator with PAS, ATPase and Fis domain
MGERPGGDSTRVRAPRIRVRYTKIRLDVTAGPDTGATLAMSNELVRVGTADDNDLVLRDDTVSRYHCELEPAEGGVRVRDLRSTNGVLVEGVRCFDALLPLSARMRLGDTELAVSPLGETVEREQTITDRFGDLVGCAPRTRELFADLERIAAMDVTVLIEGETGTGKDVVAESIHGASARSGGPFVVFDCGAVSPALAESELFGHERGAFTGAMTQHQGVFEQADGGTIFLDEIGELPKELQPKLLRVLEKRSVRRVGGTRVIPFDARVLAATNRHLRAEVARGGFREDLYFRLAAAHVVVPPLRERLDDLPLLVGHFLAAEKPPRPVTEIPQHVWDLFLAHRWPGNVRELRNAIQKLLVMPDRPPLEGSTAASVAPVPSGGSQGELLPLRVARRDAADAFERAYLAAALARTGGNVTRAAAIAEVSRQIMQKLLKKHGRE